VLAAIALVASLSRSAFTGVLFLRDVGFFERSRRFWTNEDFQEEAAIRTRIEARLRATGLNDPSLKDAYDMVREANEEPAMHTQIVQPVSVPSIHCGSVRGSVV
jgi:hypothetical protein